MPTDRLTAALEACKVQMQWGDTSEAPTMPPELAELLAAARAESADPLAVVAVNFHDRLVAEVKSWIACCHCETGLCEGCEQSGKLLADIAAARKEADRAK